MTLIGLGGVASGRDAFDTRWSLVIARAVRQDNPQSLECPPEHICLNASYDGVFDRARVLKGAPVPRQFLANVIQHTPFKRRPRVFVLVEHRLDGKLAVRGQAMAGDDGLACLPREWLISRVAIDRDTLLTQRADEICVRL